MPGKSSLGGSGKRQSSAGKNDQIDGESGKKILIWPEWNDAELAAEKWDTSVKGKDKGKGGAAAAGPIYEDPDQPRLPTCLADGVPEWKRPLQYLQDNNIAESPIVVTGDTSPSLDLLSHNKHLLKSKLMCRVISELQLLWKLRGVFPPFVPTDYDQAMPEYWSPWQHIQPWPKGNVTPVYNPQGKYCVRIHWMGEWRKVTVDDLLPLDRNGQLLLPITTCKGELWPMIITKAILKILNLEGKESCDTSVIQTLTGWFGEDQSLSVNESWDKLKPLLKKWVREPKERKEEEKKQKDKDSQTVVIGSFIPKKVTTEERSPYVALSGHAHPILMSKWRDEPLEPPPLEPPLPTLEPPYYLGLTNRKPRPGYPPPPPPKTDHRSFEIYLPFFKNSLSDNKNDSFVDVCLPNSWIDLDEFEATFSTVTVYRNPQSFNKVTYNDLSMTTPNSAAPPSGLKKGASVVQILPVKSNGNIIVVDRDEVDPVQLYLNYSCISSWHEAGNTVGLEPALSLGMRKVLEPINTNCGDDKKEDPTDEENKDTPPPEEGRSEGGTCTPSLKEESSFSVVPGSLIVQKYTWHFTSGIGLNKGAECGEKLPRVYTAGSRTVSVNLAKGRHVLKLLMNAPLGYHIDVYSPVEFKMSNEEDVWPELGKPSACYFSQGEKVFDMLTDITPGGPGTSTELPDVIKDLQQGREFTKSHIKALRVSLLRVLHVLGPHIGLGSSQMFKWKSRILRVMEAISEKVPGDREKESVSMNMADMRKLNFLLRSELINSEDQDKGKSDDTGRKSNQTLKKQKALDYSDADEEGQTDESGSHKGEEKEDEEESSSNTDLLNTAGVLLKNKRDLGVATFQCLFTLRPDILEVISLGTSEHTRVYYKKYEGVVPQMEPRGWSLLFRDSISVPCDQTIALRLSSDHQACIAKLIDNDTGALVSTDLASKFISPNSKGYTLLGEAWSYGEAIEGGTNWSLVLLSSSHFLPSLSPSNEREDCLTTTFHVIDTRRYYLPNRDYLMLRYIITVCDFCQVSIQLSTFKRDACFTLEVLDAESTIIQQEGCGHCVIPSLFLSPEAEKQEGEETSIKKAHRYIVQAFVLYESWMVDDSAWPYLSMIKSMQKEGSQSNKPSSGKKSKGRSGGTKTPKSSLTHSAHAQPYDGIDTSKPHWTLRIVTDLKNSQAITIEEDRSKEEELKMMQQAWEQSQPGRAKKAQQSRQMFLESHALKKEEGAPDEERSVVASDAGTSSSIFGGSGVPHFGPVPLKPIDFTQHIISPDGSPPKLFDQELENERLTSRQKTIREYREWRKAVKTDRELEAEHRDYVKQRQIELAESWQLQLEECRNKLNEPREKLREKYLAKHRVKTPTEDAPVVQPVSGGKDAKSKTAKGKKK